MQTGYGTRCLVLAHCLESENQSVDQVKWKEITSRRKMSIQSFHVINRWWYLDWGCLVLNLHHFFLFDWNISSRQCSLVLTKSDKRTWQNHRTNIIDKVQISLSLEVVRLGFKVDTLISVLRLLHRVWINSLLWRIAYSFVIGGD